MCHATMMTNVMGNKNGNSSWKIKTRIVSLFSLVDSYQIVYSSIYLMLPSHHLDSRSNG